MNPYLMVGSGFGTNDATSLSARLSAWHDAMVAHERWSKAIGVLGPRALELRS